MRQVRWHASDTSSFCRSCRHASDQYADKDPLILINHVLFSLCPYDTHGHDVCSCLLTKRLECIHGQRPSIAVLCRKTALPLIKQAMGAGHARTQPCMAGRRGRVRRRL